MERTSEANEVSAAKLASSVSEVRRKKSIFGFNHVNLQFKEEEVEEIRKLYRCYHKRSWCMKRAHKHFKLANLTANVSSSLLIAAGAVAGGVTMNPVVLGVISGAGLVLKTLDEMKNYKSKIEKTKFAFTTYENTLNGLRFSLRTGEFDLKEFSCSMKAIDEIINDFGIDMEKYGRKYDLLFE